MDVNHQDKTESKSAVAEDVRWVKRRKLWVPKHKKQRWKTFKDKVPFDWLNLLGVLAIPFVVTVIGLYATQQITQQQTQSSERQHTTDLQIAKDTQEEATLKAYLDDMTTLLLDKKLGSQAVADKPASAEAAVVARAKTLIVLRRLNALRKVTVVQFLYEAHLIGYLQSCNAPLMCSKPVGRIIDLNGADLSNVILRGADLSGVDLSGAILEGANLSYAHLEGAILIDADLNRANLSAAALNGAILRLAFLRFAHLNGAILIGTNLEYADLIHAILIGARMNSADLNGTVLSYANLAFVDLSGAILDGTDLQGAIVSLEQLNKAKSLRGTIMPDGSKHP
jgi:uncharacterized protein YjbI with pentapeptide repeats